MSCGYNNIKLEKVLLIFRNRRIFSIVSMKSSVFHIVNFTQCTYNKILCAQQFFLRNLETNIFYILPLQFYPCFLCTQYHHDIYKIFSQLEHKIIDYYQLSYKQNQYVFQNLFSISFNCFIFFTIFPAPQPTSFERVG